MMVSLTTGEVSSATISMSVDFLNHYRETISLSPEDKLIFARDWDEYVVGMVGVIGGG